MPPRRGAPSFNTLSPQDAASFPSSDPSSPANLLFPRSTSPSSGFSSFLSKSSKWFGRKPSDPRYAPGPPEPRSSTSSVGRKPKISRPTDPRPILSSFQSDSHVSNNASK
ncbi:hypothetical protein SERLA73DRAFT_190649 [Serpula lacrymans var. lacrymans S7.3]|uniref:Uncharacterized protein n=1 Tax=Serpula lacrymans var. lacrymans (strain S7.3) TaxID=936435 RepID=F8QG39_SERL3|nr:hypothetical protein SERLA73DRAFT_190649 [Serpula lacrymans var. lacrymans S7.3]